MQACCLFQRLILKQQLFNRFALYKTDPRYAVWVFFPVIPLSLYLLFPASIGKPQFLSLPLFLSPFYTKSTQKHSMDEFVKPILWNNIVLTNCVKPICQVIRYLALGSLPSKKNLKWLILLPLFPPHSHFPQLRECYNLKTTSGVSMTSQVLNFIGGCLGIYSTLLFRTTAFPLSYFCVPSAHSHCFLSVPCLQHTHTILVCYVIPPKSSMTILLYTNSIFQAASLCFLYYIYDYNPHGKMGVDSQRALDKATV